MFVIRSVWRLWRIEAITRNHTITVTEVQMYDFGWLWQDITDGPSTYLQFGIWHSIFFDSVASILPSESSTKEC